VTQPHITASAIVGGTSRPVTCIGTVQVVSRLDLTEAIVEVVAGVLVATGWVVGGFPDPDGAGGVMFGVGLGLAAIPALRRLLAAAAGRRPYQRDK
jgi:hypothetical protein